MNATQILTEELNTLSNDISRRIETSGAAASGATQKSLEVEVNGVVGFLKGASHIGVLKGGRKPGKVPRDFIDILKRWAQAKGLSFQDEKQFDLWANAVKWKIIREGTKLYQSKQTQDIFDTPIADFEKRLTERIGNYYEAEIKNEIFNF